MKTKTGVSKKGISVKGSAKDVFDHQLCEKIRTRLKLTEKQLPDKVIRAITDVQNKEIAKWIVSNPEEYTLKDMGVLAVSKHMPKELRDTKEDDIETIKSLEVSELRRAQILKRYNVDVGNRIDFDKLASLQKLLPFVNLHTYFYTYKVMWFNHRNCKLKKSRSYIFSASPALNKQLHESILSGKDYYEWHFNSFYKYKINPEW